MEVTYTVIRKFEKADYFLNMNLVRLSNGMINGKTLVWSLDPMEASRLTQSELSMVLYWMNEHDATETRKHVTTIKSL